VRRGRVRNQQAVTGCIAAGIPPSAFRYRTHGPTGSRLLTVSSLNWCVVCVQATSLMKEPEWSVSRCRPSDCRRLNKYVDISKEHSRAVSVQSPGFHPEGRCLIPEQATWDKVALGHVCLQALRCAAVIIIAAVTHIN
jgi:hypothetical protein